MGQPLEGRCGVDLELGCGTWNSRASRTASFPVVATDLSTEAVTAARQKYGDLVDVRPSSRAAIISDSTRDSSS